MMQPNTEIWAPPLPALRPTPALRPMPTSWHASERGFTLVEVLITVLIVSLTSAVVILNIPAAGTSAQGQADRLAATLRLASEAALMGGEPIGVEFHGGDLLIWRRRFGVWQSESLAGVGHQTALPPDLSLSLTIGGEKSEINARQRARQNGTSGPRQIRPQLVFSGRGDSEPFRLIVAEDQVEKYIETDGYGQIRIMTPGGAR